MRKKKGAVFQNGRASKSKANMNKLKHSFLTYRIVATYWSYYDYIKVVYKNEDE